VGFKPYLKDQMVSFSVWHCWFGHMTCKIVPDMTYNMFGGTLNLTLSICLMTGNCCYASLPCVDSAQKCLLAVVSWTLQPQSTLHTQKQCSALVQIHTECTDTKCTVEWQCWHCLRHCLPSPSQCTFKTFSGIFVPRVGPGQVSK